MKNSKLTVSESTTTIDTEELLSRLKGCNYDLTEIQRKITDIASIRNNIIHHFSNKPNDELINHIATIFIIVNDIINDERDFWGDRSEELNRISEYTMILEGKCIKSYADNDFSPNKSFFNCLGCGSNLLRLEKEIHSRKIICETCKSSFNKRNLVARLLSGNSPDY